MKEKPRSFRNAIGDVTPGRIIVPALNTQLQLGIRARGIPESTATTADKRMLENFAAVDKLLKFMDIEDRKLPYFSRIGKYDPKRETPRQFFSKRTATRQRN